MQFSKKLRIFEDHNIPGEESVTGSFPFLKPPKAALPPSTSLKWYAPTKGGGGGVQTKNKKGVFLITALHEIIASPLWHNYHDWGAICYTPLSWGGGALRLRCQTEAIMFRSSQTETIPDGKCLWPDFRAFTRLYPHEIIAPHYGIITMIGGGAIGYMPTKLGGGGGL